VTPGILATSSVTALAQCPQVIPRTVYSVLVTTPLLSRQVPPRGIW
jgi:hypothetical protein